MYQVVAAVRVCHRRSQHKRVGEFGVKAFDKQICLEVAEVVVPVHRGIDAARTLFLQPFGADDGDELTAYVADVQVFVEGLRGTESLGIAEADIDVLRRIVADIGTGTEDSFVHNTVLIHTTAQQEAPPLVLPLVLRVGAGYVHHLIEGDGGVLVYQLLQTVARGSGVFCQGGVAILLRVGGLVVQVVVIELNAAGQVGRHEEAVVEVIDVLRAQHAGEVGGLPVGAVIALALDVLGGSVEAISMLLIGGEAGELDAAGVDGVFYLLHQSGFAGAVEVGIFGNVGRQIHAVTTPAELFHMMIFQA